MRKTGIHEQALVTAVAEMMAGLVDADLGGRVFKKRVAIQGRGKRAGARTIVATHLGERWIYLYGFEKNDRHNIDNEELKALQKLARILLELSAEDIVAEVDDGELIELRVRDP